MRRRRFPSRRLCPGAADSCRRVIDNWCMRELTAVITAPRRTARSDDARRARGISRALRLLSGWHQGRGSDAYNLRRKSPALGTLSRSFYQPEKKKEYRRFHLRPLKMDRSLWNMDRRINIVEREVTWEQTRLFLKYAVHVLNRASICRNEKLFDVYISLSSSERLWHDSNFPDVVSQLLPRVNSQSV